MLLMLQSTLINSLCKAQDEKALYNSCRTHLILADS